MGQLWMQFNNWDLETITIVGLQPYPTPVRALIGGHDCMVGYFQGFIGKQDDIFCKRRRGH